MPSDRNPEVDYERSDVAPRLVAMLGGIVALTVIASLAGLALGFSHTLHEQPIRHIDPPAPDLQIHPGDDLAAFRAAEDRRLHTYGWVDQANGVVHIPIAQAMQDIATEGAPQWPAASPR